MKDARGNITLCTSWAALEFQDFGSAAEVPCVQRSTERKTPHSEMLTSLHNKYRWNLKVSKASYTTRSTSDGAFLS